MIEVVVVDDEPLVRTGLGHVLAVADDIKATALLPVREAAERLTEYQPQVVFLDCCPEETPALQHALDRMPVRPAVCVLSRKPDEDLAAFALGHGARGYVLKTIAPDRYAPLARFIAGGWTMISAEISRTFIGEFLAHTARRTDTELVERLTARERAVLVLMAAGLSNAEIGRRLHLAHGTVKDHVGTVLSKLEATGRVQAALRAERAGLLLGTNLP
ncbi:response regulator transcription factor [Streptomyces sp. NPDC054863]